MQTFHEKSTQTAAVALERQGFRWHSTHSPQSNPYDRWVRDRDGSMAKVYLHASTLPGFAGTHLVEVRFCSL